MQFGISAVGGLAVSAWQNAQTLPTAFPMAGTIAVSAVLALGVHLSGRSPRTMPTAAGEAEDAMLVAEH